MKTSVLPINGYVRWLLTHWKEIAGTGGTESRKTLVRYCGQWSPLYKLENEAKWLLSGSIDCNALLQLMLFLRREEN